MMSEPKAKRPSRKRKGMNVPDIAEVRTLFQHQLPMMIGEAMDAYQTIINGSDEQDHKISSARHGAARTALAHIQQLIRLCEWAKEGDAKASQESSQDQEQAMDEIIAAARQRMKESHGLNHISSFDDQQADADTTNQPLFEDDEEEGVI